MSYIKEYLDSFFIIISRISMVLLGISAYTGSTLAVFAIYLSCVFAIARPIALFINKMEKKS